MSAFKILPLREKSSHKPKCQSGLCHRQSSNNIVYSYLQPQLQPQLPQQPTIIIQNIIQPSHFDPSQYIMYPNGSIFIPSSSYYQPSSMINKNEIDNK